MIIDLQHTSVLKAPPRQRISNIYIYLYVSDQSGYTEALPGVLGNGNKAICFKVTGERNAIFSGEKENKQWNLGNTKFCVQMI